MDAKHHKASHSYQGYGFLCVFARADKWYRDSMCHGKTILILPLLGSHCGKDAVLAAEAGCEGIVLSNHGGEL